MVDLSSIQNAAIFEGVGQPEIRELESIARVEQAAKGDCLFSHGDAADTFYLVKDGKFALTIQVRALDEHFEMPIEEKVAGEALGWSALVEPHRSIYSAYCTQEWLGRRLFARGSGRTVVFESESRPAILAQFESADREQDTSAATTLDRGDRAVHRESGILEPHQAQRRMGRRRQAFAQARPLAAQYAVLIRK